MDLETSYDSVDEVDEDAELELSCALQDLASRCKSFSAKMTDEIPEIDDNEISEDEDLHEAAEAKLTLRRRSDCGSSLDAKEDFVNQTQKELSSIQSNIKHLLEKLEDEAKRNRYNHDDDDDDDAKQRGTTNQRQEK